MSKEGLFVCIEGGDGTGKGTQFDLLKSRLVAQGEDVVDLDFPQYGQPSAELVELYLNGEFGDPTKLDGRIASAFYAIDRASVRDDLIKAQKRGAIIVANRFTSSNMAFQGAKIDDRKERVDFFKWAHRLEHDILGIPEPDMHFVLRVPAEIAQARVLNKPARGYTTKKLDGHEANLEFLKRAEQTYLDLVETFPDRFELIECVLKDGKELSIEEVHELVWKRVEDLKS